MGDLSDLAKVDYLARVNRAIDHVTRNLDQPLRLEDVAAVGAFSPFHFHRVFRAVVGETLHAFVLRLRLERAAHLMSHDRRRSLTELALACGFASSSDFSRSFRRHFGASPRQFDLARHRDTHRAELVGTDGRPVTRLPEGHNPYGFTAPLRALPARRVAYLRVFEPYKGHVPTTAARLVAWAEARGLAGGQWLGFQWDDPEIVPLERCRYDVGVEVPDEAVLDGEVHEVRFPAMTVAEVSVAGPIEHELHALDWLYGAWLPHSGWAPDHQPCFEAWSGVPFAHGLTHFELRLQLAVTR